MLAPHVANTLHWFVAVRCPPDVMRAWLFAHAPKVAQEMFDPSDTATVFVAQEPPGEVVSPVRAGSWEQVADPLRLLNAGWEQDSVPDRD